jgi:hypothetical protein
MAETESGCLQKIEQISDIQLYEHYTLANPVGKKFLTIGLSVRVMYFH